MMKQAIGNYFLIIIHTNETIQPDDDNVVDLFSVRYYTNKSDKHKNSLTGYCLCLFSIPDWHSLYFAIYIN